MLLGIKNQKRRLKTMSWEDKIKRKEIFEDTMGFINENEFLLRATEDSVKNTVFYAEDEYIALKAGSGSICKLTLSSKRSFEAARDLGLRYPAQKIAVLNFASAAKPGGGCKEGAGAQEESLCRCSNLYPTLAASKMEALFYAPHIEKKDNLHNDDCIYSPGIIVCKSDENFPKRLEEKDFYAVDVITCAAPNLNLKSVKRYNPDAARLVNISDEKLYDLHLKRAKHILNIAAGNGAKLFVGGAFGAGVFQNNPKTVARAWLDAAKEYASYFTCIDFAIKPSRKGSKGAENYSAFEEVLKDCTNLS